MHMTCSTYRLIIQPRHNYSSSEDDEQNANVQHITKSKEKSARRSLALLPQLLPPPAPRNQPTLTSLQTQSQRSSTSLNCRQHSMNSPLTASFGGHATLRYESPSSNDTGKGMEIDIQREEVSAAIDRQTGKYAEDHSIRLYI